MSCIEIIGFISLFIGCTLTFYGILKDDIDFRLDGCLIACFATLLIASVKQRISYMGIIGYMFLFIGCALTFYATLNDEIHLKLDGRLITCFATLLIVSHYLSL